MPLDCPRCALRMSEASATSPSGAAVVVDGCGRCGGAWIKPDRLPAVAPRLAETAARAAPAGRRGAGITACPGCLEAPLEIPVGRLLIDLCTQCGGVWLDSGELEALGAPDPAPGAGAAAPYRRMPDAAAAQAVRCVACGTEIPLEKSHVSAQGPLCPFCNAEAAITATRRELAAQVTIGDPGAPRAARVVHRDLDPEAYERAERAELVDDLLSNLSDFFSRR